MQKTKMPLQSVSSGKSAIAGYMGAIELELRLVDVSAVPCPFVATSKTFVAFNAWERRRDVIWGM